jgi:micrococcal nuclease
MIALLIALTGIALADVLPNYAHLSLVTSAYDGDTMDATILLGGRVFIDGKIRLLRCDTPEMNSVDLVVRSRAIKARDFTRSAVVGKSVVAVTTKQDSFGRYLAEVYYGSPQKNLCDDLLAAGLATVWKP